jgi:hypothetical protein
MRALAKDPENRYATALEMANDLTAIRATLDARQSLPGTVSLRSTIEHALDQRRTSHFRRVRRRRVALSGAGVAAAGVLVLSGWFLARRGMPARATVDTARAGAPAAGAPAPTLSGSPNAPAPNQPRASDPNGDANAAGAKPADSRRAGARPQDSASAKRPVARAQVEPTKTASAPTSPQQSPPPKSAAAGTTQVVTNPPAGTTTASGAGAPVTQQAPAPAPPPAIATPSKPTVSIPQQINPSAAPAPTAANSAAEIGGVIDVYARAIESRDMAELRRVYATITSDQASAFSDFFKSTRLLRATLAVKSLQVDGNHATARVAGTYEFTTSSGRAQQQTVSFEADLRHDGGAWKLVAVR